MKPSISLVRGRGIRVRSEDSQRKRADKIYNRGLAIVFEMRRINVGLNALLSELVGYGEIKARISRPIHPIDFLYPPSPLATIAWASVQDEMAFLDM